MERLAPDRLLQEVKRAVQALEPSAEVKLYGSRSRQDAGPESDWDFLILVDGPVSATRADALRHGLHGLLPAEDAWIA
jgi:predicted nucleotidyltransferase